MSIEIDTPPQPTGAYLLLFRNSNWDYGLSDDETRRAMGKVKEWFDGLFAAGKIVSAQPLMEEKAFISGKGGSSVTDGPFAEAKEVIGGYSIFEFKNKEEAVAMAVEFMQLHKDHMPGWDGTCEVRATASSCPHLYRLNSRLAEAVA